MRIPPLCTKLEASRLCRCSQRHIDRLLSAGKISCVQPNSRGRGRPVLIKTASILELIQITLTEDMVAYVWPNSTVEEVVDGQR